MHSRLLRVEVAEECRTGQSLTILIGMCVALSSAFRVARSFLLAAAFLILVLTMDF